MSTHEPVPRPPEQSSAERPTPLAVARIREQFHGLIRSRAREGGLRVPRRLPSLDDPPIGSEEPRWFAVPGMYGGFAYRLQLRGGELQLADEDR